MSDLRYSSKPVHANFDPIVRGGLYLGRGMPSFADILTERQVREIHAYVVAQARERPEPDALQRKEPVVAGSAPCPGTRPWRQ